MRLQSAVALTVASLVLVTGCTTSADPASVTGIPGQWLEDTAEGWPESDAFGGDIPVLGNDACLFGEVIPEILEEDPEGTDSGWGSYGDDPTAADSYRYLCDFWSEGRYAGSLQLIRASDRATADQTVQQFVSQTDTADQDNTVTTVQAGRLEMNVLSRWYPTNPQGEYQAMYLDTESNAVVVLEVDSLSEADFADYSDQRIAEDLLAALAAGG